MQSQHRNVLEYVMKVFTADKVVVVHADVVTDQGEFRVYPNGYIERWNEWDYYWAVYDKDSKHYDEIKQIGMEVIK